MLLADKIFKSFTKFNPTFAVWPFYQKHNFKQFCPKKVCQIILCEHVKLSNYLILFKSWLYAALLREFFPGGTNTDTGPLASASFVETGTDFCIVIRI